MTRVQKDTTRPHLRTAVLAGRVRRSWISGAVAGALTVASAGFLLSSVTAFRRAGTTVDPLVVERAESLVTTGVFRLTQNPMYLGMAGLLLAHAALRKRFGRAFDDFARSTPRWLDSRSIRSLR